MTKTSEVVTAAKRHMVALEDSAATARKLHEDLAAKRLKCDAYLQSLAGDTFLTDNLKTLAAQLFECYVDLEELVKTEDPIVDKAHFLMQSFEVVVDKVLCCWPSKKSGHACTRAVKALSSTVTGNANDFLSGCSRFHSRIASLLQWSRPYLRKHGVPQTSKCSRCSEGLTEGDRRCAEFYNCRMCTHWVHARCLEPLLQQQYPSIFGPKGKTPENKLFLVCPACLVCRLAGLALVEPDFRLGESHLGILPVSRDRIRPDVLELVDSFEHAMESWTTVMWPTLQDESEDEEEDLPRTPLDELRESPQPQTAAVPPPASTTKTKTKTKTKLDSRDPQEVRAAATRVARGKSPAPKTKRKPRRDASVDSDETTDDSLDDSDDEERGQPGAGPSRRPKTKTKHASPPSSNSSSDEEDRRRDRRKKSKKKSPPSSSGSSSSDDSDSDADSDKDYSPSDSSSSSNGNGDSDGSDDGDDSDSDDKSKGSRSDRKKKKKKKTKSSSRHHKRSDSAELKRLRRAMRRLPGVGRSQHRIRRRIRRMLHVAAASSTCQRCRGSQSTTCTYCPRCRRRLCSRCSPVEPSRLILPIVPCARCEVRQGGHSAVLRLPGPRRLRRRLTLAYQHMTQRALRSTSVATVQRGIRDYEAYADRLCEEAFPATPLSVANYIVYSVTCREPATLDSSTVQTYAQGQSLRHDVAREVTGLPLLNPYKTRQVRRVMKHVAENFKKQSKAKLPWSIRQMRRMYRDGFRPTRSGRHQRLCLMFQNLGILRRNAARRLRVVYRVRGGVIRYGARSSVRVDRTGRRPFIRGAVLVDKNVTARKQREFYIPDEVPALRLRPVEMLEHYLLNERPPSGGYLLAAPLGRAGFRSTPYGNQTAAFRAAYRAAHPSARDAHRFGSGSARKAMSQWLWSAGWAKRVIADAGGWFSRKSAVDLYFKTEPQRILHAIRHIGRVRGRNRR